VSTERGQNVLLHDRNITIEVTLDQQSRVIEENDNSAEAFNTSHEQESVNEFTPLTPMSVINAASRKNPPTMTM
jgi:hypothetical protein